MVTEGLVVVLDRTGRSLGLGTGDLVEGGSRQCTGALLGRGLGPTGHGAIGFDLDRVNATALSKAERSVIGGVIGQVLLQGIPGVVYFGGGGGRTALASLGGSGGHHRGTSLAVNVDG